MANKYKADVKNRRAKGIKSQAPEVIDTLINTQPKNTQDIYTTLLSKQDKEKRNKRVQIVVKPSTFAYIEQLQKDGVIKSKNDLINNFLEEFIARAEEHKTEDEG